MGEEALAFPAALSEAFLTLGNSPVAAWLRPWIAGAWVIP
jgi:hypothetical protein